MKRHTFGLSTNETDRKHCGPLDVYAIKKHPNGLINFRMTYFGYRLKWAWLWKPPKGSDEIKRWKLRCLAFGEPV